MLEKLTITPNTGERVVAMYNPAEFSLETRNQFQRNAMPGLPVPITQFTSGETRTISLELFFDTSETHEDVRNHTQKVIKLLKIDPSLHAPPVCTFTWGGKPLTGEDIGFTGVIDSASQRFTMFHESGVPIRARVTISVSEYRTLTEQLSQLGLQSADHTKRRIFKEGESLWLLANEEYNNPGLWREIAQENRIDNPRLVDPGTEITVPPLV